MNNWKQFNVLSLLVVFVIVLCFIGCDPEGAEQPEFREGTANFDFEGDVRSAKVRATLLEAEWTGVVGKVESAINNAFVATEGDFVKGMVFRNVFGDNVTITVEKTSTYKLKVIDGQFRTLYMSIDFLNTPDSQKIIDALYAMAVPEEYIF